MLLQKLPEFMDDDDSRDGLAASVQADPARLIISQLRWMMVIEDPELLLAELMNVLPVCPALPGRLQLTELMQVCSHRIKCELITFLPEILQPGQHHVSKSASV